MSNNPTFECPINLNLDGTFSIEHSDRTYTTGDLNPDLRLPHLNEFLESVESVLREDKQVQSRLADIIARLSKTVKSKKRQLVIKCDIDKDSKSMTYSFTIT